MSFVKTEVVLTDGSRETVYYLTEEGKERFLRHADRDEVYHLKLALSTLIDYLHNQLVEYFKRKIIGVLESSGKAWRRYELTKELKRSVGTFFWLQIQEAVENLLEKGEIIEKRGWIKLKKKEAFEE